MKNFKNYLRENTIELLPYLQKVINDEISAYILYTKIYMQLKGSNFSEFREQMIEHSEDEKKHFETLIKIVHSKFPSFDLDINITKDANIKILNSNIMSYVQMLEENAINDYKKLIEISTYLNDKVLEDIFIQILKDEEEHLNDVLILN